MSGIGSVLIFVLGKPTIIRPSDYDTDLPEDRSNDPRSSFVRDSGESISSPVLTFPLHYQGEEVEVMHGAYAGRRGIMTRRVSLCSAVGRAFGGESAAAELALVSLSSHFSSRKLMVRSTERVVHGAVGPEDEIVRRYVA